MKNMNRVIYILITLCILFITGCAHTIKQTGPAEEGDIYEEVLPNGLKVIALEDPDAVLSVFQVWYHAGSINEQPSS